MKNFIVYRDHDHVFHSPNPCGTIEGSWDCHLWQTWAEPSRPKSLAACSFSLAAFLLASPADRISLYTHGLVSAYDKGEMTTKCRNRSIAIPFSQGPYCGSHLMLLLSCPFYDLLSPRSPLLLEGDLQNSLDAGDIYGQQWRQSVGSW